jgi:hypothetical protein
VTEFDDGEFDEGSSIAPQDVASAARSCQAILIIILFTAMVGCAALGVYLIS